MAQNRSIKTQLYDDEWVFDLSTEAKFLYVFLLTNKNTEISGYYEMKLHEMEFYTKIPRAKIEKLLKNLEPKVYYVDGWVIISKYDYHQNYANNQKVQKSIENYKKKIPTHILNYKSEIINHKSEAMDSLSIAYPQNNDEKASEMATLLRDMIKENMPTFRDPDLEKWAEHIEKTHRIDGRTYEQIEYVIRWCQKDEFWQANILSTSKLRKQFDQLVAHIKRGKSNSKSITVI